MRIIRRYAKWPVTIIGSMLIGYLSEYVYHNPTWVRWLCIVIFGLAMGLL